MEADAHADAVAAGFVRVAACSLPVHLADPAANAQAIADQADAAARAGANLVVFPELSLTGYCLDDLFMQSALLDATEAALAQLARASADWPAAVVVGAPLRVTHRLYNCAVVIAAGRVLGAVPKSYLPNYREFYEHRQFASGLGLNGSVVIAGETVRVGPNQLFDIGFGSPAAAPVADVAPAAQPAADVTPAAQPAADVAPAAGLPAPGLGAPVFRLGVEVCEDLWVPISPGAAAALAGAEVVANCSSSPITVGKARQRRLLSQAQSARLICGYVFAASGWGESSTDLGWDGQTMVFERGELLAQGPRFDSGPVTTLADVDLALIRQDRLRQGTFDDNRVANSGLTSGFRVSAARLGGPAEDGAQPRPTALTGPERSAKLGQRGGRPNAGAGAAGERGGRRGIVRLMRPTPRFPFVPDDPARLDQDCYEAYNIQVSALVRRLTAIGRPKVVIGLSGGLDSSQALIVAAKAINLLGLPRGDILAYTLPGFATTEATKANAIALAEALGVSFEEIDIRPAARRLLADLDHPFARGLPVYDVTFENVQAGLRTDYLFRLANQRGGIVLGTGDLSELALGWCTYGVGDQMSHYNVNAGVPKTLIQHLIRWVVKTGQFDAAVGRTLQAVVDTEISPELVPPDRSGEIQSTQSVIGPYPLADFALYYTMRFGLTPRQVFYRLRQAWQDPDQGSWPEDVPPADRRGYSPAQLAGWLEVFYQRFFTSQFKRSALPNGPKVIAAGSLSPRGDWRQPSDVAPVLWRQEIEAIKAAFG
ncbi:MAG: NAD(+) synthase [Bifidobacteriaceae bacterium]|nr:NAD(+) synthase [Bifidobacteriaceae bacterium]